MLWNEIDYNCRTIDGIVKKLSTDLFLKTIKPEQYGYGNGIIYKFEAYNEIKYELLKYNSEIVQDVINIYYKMIFLSNHIDLKELSQEEFDMVKTLFELKSKIKGFVEAKI